MRWCFMNDAGTSKRRCGHLGLFTWWPLLVVTQTALAEQTIVWVGGNGLSWNTPLNWSPAQVPGIGAPGADAVVSTASGLVTASTGGPITLSTLLTGTAVRFSGISVSMASGDTTLQGAPSGQIENLGTVTVPAGGGPTFAKPFRNSGAFSFSSSLSIQTGGAFTNMGTMTASGAGSLAVSGVSSALFVNDGTLARSAAGALSIQMPYAAGTSAAVECTAGEIRFQGPSTHAGSVALASGTFMKLQAPSGLSAEIVGDLSISGDGACVVASATHIVDNAALTSALQGTSMQGLLIQSSYPVTIDGVLANDGAMTWDYATLDGHGQLHNEGMLWLTASSRLLQTTMENHSSGTVVQAGPLAIGDAIVLNDARATWRLDAGSITPASSLAQPLFSNSGSIIRAGTALGVFFQLSVPLASHDGAITVQGPGNLSLNNDCTFDGDFNLVDVAPSRSLYIQGTRADVYGGLDLIGEGTCAWGTTCTLACDGGIVRNFISPPDPSLGGCILSGSLECSGGGAMINEGFMELGGSRIGTGSNPGAKLINKSLMHSVNPIEVRGELVNESGATFKQFSNVTLRGGTVTNEGDYLLGTDSAVDEDAAGGSFLNRPGASLRLETGAASSSIIYAHLDNQGSVIAGDGGALSLWDVAQISDHTLTGGTWIARDASHIWFDPATITAIGAGATIIVGGAGASIEPMMIHSIESEALLELSGSVHSTGPLENDGDIRIIAPGILESDESVDNGILGEIEEKLVLGVAGAEGPTLATPLLTNHGTLIPGGEDAAGPFTLIGSLVASGTSVIKVQLGGLAAIVDHDQVVISGSCALAGTLALSFLGEYEPRVGDQFTVLVAKGGVSGSFDQVTGPGTFDVAYAPGAVTVTVLSIAVAGDLNGDGRIDGTDLGLLLGAWGTSEADLDGDGTTDGTDLGLLLGNWS